LGPSQRVVASHRTAFPSTTGERGRKKGYQCSSKPNRGGNRDTSPEYAKGKRIDLARQSHGFVQNTLEGKKNRETRETGGSVGKINLVGRSDMTNHCCDE